MDVDGDGVPRPTDCDDADPSLGGATNRYPDADRDGFGGGAPTESCTSIDGYVEDGSDCDDTDPEVNTAGLELCDGVDNNCADGADESTSVDADTWYIDADGDGYGTPEGPVAACSQPEGRVLSKADCNDADPAISPGQSETCGGVDENCDGAVDEDSAVDAPIWYADRDADGFGDPLDAQTACSRPALYLDNAEDCDDNAGSANPLGVEECGNGIDEDCANGIDDGCFLLGARDVGAANAVIAASSLSGFGSLMAGGVDVNGDGRPDLVATEYSSGETQAWVLDGGIEGTFALTSSGGVDVGFTSRIVEVDAADTDGDGVGELILSQRGGLGIYAGPVTAGVDPAALATLVSYDQTGFYDSVVQDFDGDGDVDLGTAVLPNESVATVLAINDQWSGEREMKDTTAHRTLRSGCGAGVVSISGNEDYDADGIADLLLGAPGTVECPIAYLVLGPITGTDELSDAAVWTLAEDHEDTTGQRVELVHDADGDGLADILVTAPSSPSEDDAGNVGIALLFAENSLGIAFTTDFTARFEPGEERFDGLGGGASSPNLDGDDYSDIVLGSNSDAAIWFGPFTGVLSATSADITFAGSVAGGRLGADMVNLGDVQGFGFDTIALSEPDAEAGSGIVYVINGTGR